MKKFLDNIDWVKQLGMVAPLIFMLIIGAYHAGLFGDKYAIWWTYANHLLIITMGVVIILLTYSEKMRNIYKYVVIPYFALKLFYHLVCNYNWYIVSPKTWQLIWNEVLILVAISGLIIIMFKED